MRAMTAALIAAATTATAAPAPKGEAAKLEFKAYPNSYFVKNTAGVKDGTTVLVLAGKGDFDKVFQAVPPAGLGRPGGAKKEFLPADKDDYAKLLVVAVVTQGKAMTTYAVDGVEAMDGVVTVKYKFDSKGAGGTATFSSPLVVSVEKGKYSKVVFLDGDAKAGEVEVK